MKTTITRLAITVACCLTLVSSCKKDDSNDEAKPAPTPTPTATVDNYFMLNGHKYIVYDMLAITTTSPDYYVLNTWSAYQGDTLQADIAFATTSPTEGSHSIDPNATDAYMTIQTSTQTGEAENGTCVVSKVNGHYKFTYTNINFREDNSQALVKLSGVVLTK